MPTAQIASQSTELVSLVYALGAAIVALVSAQVAVVITHWLTAKRERRKAEGEQEERRREILRSKLEELVDLISARLEELQVRSDTPIPLAATLAAGTAMPWKYNEAGLASNSLLRAQTLVVLYFPELLDDVLELAEHSEKFRRFVDVEFQAVNQDPRKWLAGAALAYPERCERELQDFKNKLVDIQLKAREAIMSRLLSKSK
jgi:hypothetical protein